MKRNRNMITMICSVLLLALGFVGLHVVYDVVFHPASIVDGQIPLPENMENAPEEFVKTLKIHQTEELSILTETQISNYIADSYLYFDDELYDRLFAIAGVPYKDMDWSSFQGNASNETDILLETATETGDSFCELSILFKEFIPSAFFYGNNQTPTSLEMETAVEVLNEYVETPGNSPILTYVQQIDNIYESCSAYHNKLTRMYAPFAAENQEISFFTTLWDCCSNGIWQVFSDSREIVVVCIMGESYLVLYYDAVTQSFNGYNLAFFSPDN